MGELMNDRYTIQVVTPNGNLLGSMKVSPLMIGRILGSIDEEYSKNISYYTNQKENTIDGLSDQQKRSQRYMQRTSEIIREMSKQIDWALHNGEVL